MQAHADPYLCPGHANNGWQIHRDCIDCARHRNPLGERNVYWLSPPVQMPCDKRVPKERR